MTFCSVCFFVSFVFAVPAASPHLIQSTTVNPTTVLITWQPPPPEHQNGIITAYVVHVSLEENEN